MGKLLDVALIVGSAVALKKLVDAAERLGKPGDHWYNKVPEAHTTPVAIPDGDKRTAQELIAETEKLVPIGYAYRWTPVKAQLNRAKRTGRLDDARAAYEGAKELDGQKLFDKRNAPWLGDDL